MVHLKITVPSQWDEGLDATQFHTQAIANFQESDFEHMPYFMAHSWSLLEGSLSWY